MLSTPFIRELGHEIISTRKMLERLPQDKLDWKPHEKSMSLGRLATHIAEIPGYMLRVLTSDGINFETANYKPANLNNVQDIVALFDKGLAEATPHLEKVSDEEMFAQWSLSKDGTPMFSQPRIAALRGFVFSHLIHHRGQLSVYMRLLDIPVPSIYGPSADEAA